MSVPAIAPIEPSANGSTAVATRPALGLLKPVAPPAQIIAQQNEMRAFIKEVLEEGRDYGLIPGVDKPSLLQPGAQRINVGFGVIPHYTTIEVERDHDRVVEWSKRKKIYENKQWTGGWSIESGTSIGVYRYVVRCELVHRETGIVVGESLGACSTLEAKYIDRPRESENTCLKMAQKRAFVGATLTCYGLSDEFTQDVEDTGVSGGAEDPPGPQKVQAPLCPKHHVPMRDQRASKKNPKAPDWKCTRKDGDTYCEEVKWPGQWPPKSEGKETGNGDGGTTPAHGAASSHSAATAPTPTSSPSTATSKRPEDITVRGVRLGDLTTAELATKLEAAKASNDPKHQPLIAAMEAVLENRRESGDSGPDDGDDDSDLPF